MKCRRCFVLTTWMMLVTFTLAGCSQPDCDSAPAVQLTYEAWTDCGGERQGVIRISAAANADGCSPHSCWQPQVETTSGESFVTGVDFWAVCGKNGRAEVDTLSFVLVDTTSSGVAYHCQGANPDGERISCSAYDAAGNVVSQDACYLTLTLGV